MGEGSQLKTIEALFAACHCVAGRLWLFSNTAHIVSSPETLLKLVQFGYFEGLK